MDEIGLTDLSKSECAMAHPAHPGTTGLYPIVRTYNWILGLQIIFHGAELIEAGAKFRNESF